MDYPKLTFGPAGNTKNSSGFLVDLDDIFDDDFFPSDIDFSKFFRCEEEGIDDMPIQSMNTRVMDMNHRMESCRNNSLEDINNSMNNSLSTMTSSTIAMDNAIGLDKFNSESKIKAETKVTQDPLHIVDDRNRSSSMGSTSIYSNTYPAVHNTDKMDYPAVQNTDKADTNKMDYKNKMDSGSMDSAIDKLLNFDQNENTYDDNDVNTNKNYYPDNNPTRITGFTDTNNMNYYNPTNYNSMITQESNVNIPSIPHIASNSYRNDYATNIMNNIPDSTRRLDTLNTNYNTGMNDNNINNNLGIPNNMSNINTNIHIPDKRINTDHSEPVDSNPADNNDWIKKLLVRKPSSGNMEGGTAGAGNTQRPVPPVVKVEPASSTGGMNLQNPSSNFSSSSGGGADVSRRLSASQQFDYQQEQYLLRTAEIQAQRNQNGVIQIAPVMPRPGSLGGGSTKEDSPRSPGTLGFRDDDDDLGKKRKKVKALDPKDLTEEQRVERRERNREHAKKSRIRKRVLLDLLQDQLTGLRGENVKLRRVVIERLPHVASKVLQSCTTEESMLLMCDEDALADKSIRDAQGAFQLHMRQHSDQIQAAPQASSSSGAGLGPPKQMARILMEPDFRLIEALIHSQQNFVLSDPSLPDNPIVYCSEGFCKLTGYKRQHILGRNCRFLQGPGTDQGAVDIIRKGVMEGCDISVCLLNYKADGSPFWNQFFVAALKDSEGGVVNYVGVQCEVNNLPIQGLKKRVKSLPVPIMVHPKI
mmetsp:Transcript_15890/g.15259  ORF Transcript_15890/g.15259 Transcript_15890/m.15259 type:complete len:754 (+) Transcript_15890:248-2509(+)